MALKRASLMFFRLWLRLLPLRLCKFSMVLCGGWLPLDNGRSCGGAMDCLGTGLLLSGKRRVACILLFLRLIVLVGGGCAIWRLIRGCGGLLVWRWRNEQPSSLPEKLAC